MIQTSYVFSKLLTDTDTYLGSNLGGPIDHYNRRLEKSVGAFDQTHLGKVNYVLEIPFGAGKRFLREGIAGKILGGWRLAGVHLYASGTPIALFNSVDSSFLFNGRNAAQISSLDGWTTNLDNPDYRGTDRFFQSAAFFGPQNPNVIGNAPRYNARVRTPPQLNENFSLARSFSFTEGVRLDIRAETFNTFNRVQFNPGSTNIQDPNFGTVTNTLNEPRRLQFGAKLYF